MSKKSSMQALTESSYLFGGNTAYLEEMYEDYLHDANSVAKEWQDFFANLPKVNGAAGKDLSHESIKSRFIELAKQPVRTVEVGDAHSQKQSHVTQLINAYRSHGHHAANVDPLAMRVPEHVSDLELNFHGLSSADLSQNFFIDGFDGVDKSQTSLAEIVNALKAIYTQSIGIEFMHISDQEQTQWLQNRLETAKGKPTFTREEKLAILQLLVAADGLENYLAKKYVGQKRFSVEGSDSLIPLLSDIVSHGASKGIKECIIGMAHRGRLNVLVNTLGKAPANLFQEFEGVYKDEDRSGDVKYHLGFSSDIQTANGVVHVALGFNPSHLEIISPVVEGAVRARQDKTHDFKRDHIIPISIHGDAAFAGQGVVMETFNMSQARGYCTGGTIHIVINNQIGFTTSNPLDARSTLYCTDVAKMVQAPVIHVNGDDPEAVVFAGRIAVDFRQKFKKDIVIDLVSYRRHGHNESDEPTITQPVMYRKIKDHPTPVALYAQQLLQQGIIENDTLSKMTEAYRNALDHGDSVVDLVKGVESYIENQWKPFLKKPQTHDIIKTGYNKAKLVAIGKKLLETPADFTIPPQVKREYDARLKMMDGELPLQWGMAETLAYATLLEQGYAVRISGQDSGRGTFSHRYAVLHDFNNDNVYIPLEHVAKDQPMFTVIDSVLSEEAVLAFEYGYAATYPNQLVIWEAQFGDFFNGAQVVVDQFISSGEQKWGRLCPLTLFLPHGYEGMGPEHSSARLERFLQLCAQQNMQVCVPTTPAQAFHMIRRQMLADYRKPLVVMTPKSLLRHKSAISSLDDLANGHFMELIPEQTQHDANAIKRVIICSGKVYYDLVQYQEEQQRKDVAIIRVEQLYPFPEELLTKELAQYKNAKEVIWCQEEPKNQGAWYSTQHHLLSCLADGQRLVYAGRDAFAAPAVGYHSMHVKQQKALVEDAFKS